jgi:predicted metal-dependent hydrolase
MQDPVAEYERRYLGGILFFNQRDFFEAHEVWESLWLDCAGPERTFYQGLIQAAVVLYHFGNGNLRGAAKLYRTSRAYMEKFGSPYLGLDTASFWKEMGRCFAPLLADPHPDRDLRPDRTLIPVIALHPPPSRWPDPAEFQSDED